VTSGEPGVPAVRRVRPGDGPRLRELRVAALAQTPIAFLETHAEAVRHRPQDWEDRVARHAAGAACAMYVADAGDRWVGMMGGYVDPAGRAVLIAVHVDPAFRGGPVAGRLLAAVAGWARTEVGADRLWLEVHEDNARARSFYRRVGFTETGVRRPYPLDPSRDELEMVLPLL
jgi:ribosomal protein S18 acetylase RimI-like enzyme